MIKFPTAAELQQMAPDDLTSLIQSIDREKNRLDRELAVNESQRQSAENEVKKHEAELQRVVGSADEKAVEQYIAKCSKDAAEALAKLQQLYAAPEQEPERMIKHA